MLAAHSKRHSLQTFYSFWSILLLCALVLSGLPLSAAQAAGAVATKEGVVMNPPRAQSAASGADVTLGIHPLERVMIGEDFGFYASFDNSVDTGYGPFIDLIFPTNGADGAAGTATPDGLTFVSAAYDGYVLTDTSLVFPDADGPTGPGTTGCVAHPLAVDATGSPAQVCGTAGDTLVVLELPFSSITQDMPTIYTEVTAHTSNLADVDIPLTILGRGGYRFGADSLNNPSTDPAILNPSSTDGSGWPSLQVTPRVIAIEKTFDGPKECPYNLPDEPVLDESECPYGSVNPVYESVSGPNFPRQYDINIYVAAGQTVTNIDVTDYFPNNLAFLSVTPGSGTVVDSPTIGAAANPPNNDLIVRFASLTGSAHILVSFFIPEFDANGTPVLDPATGASAIAQNTATALGDWTPVDTRDPGGPDNAIANGPSCPGDCVPLHELDIRSMAVQKLVEIWIESGAPGYSPGDVLKYTLEFQISDYFTFGDLVLTDVLTDGQRFDNVGGDLPPVFSVSDWNNPTPLTGSFVTGNDLIITDPSAPTGDTTLAFNISTAMTNAGAADGILQGGEAGATGAVPAVGTITFYATIQEDFSYNYPSGDASVDHGDVLFNSATLTASIRDENTITTVLNTQTNDSVQKFEIVHGDLEKDIYAVNGSTTFTPEVQPKGTITFRLRMSLPSSDSDNLVLTDFLPLPIFDAAEISTFDNVTDATVPAAGHAKFGPDSTLNAAQQAPVLPTISAYAAANSLSFDFGSFDDLMDTSTQIDILFTLTVSSAPYVDGAVLTNLALSDEGTTNNGDLYHGGAERFTLKEPGISLRKGVVASNNSTVVFVPAPPAPVTFNAPGSNPSWSGVIASSDNNPATSLINSDVQDVKGGDLLTFAIVLENLGHSTLGAFDISVKDTLPTGLQIPAGGINLQARRGDGAAVTYAPVGSTATEPSGLFDGGIIFTDESPALGATRVYSPTGGQNLIVVTYDLQVATGLTPGAEIVNTATLLGYAGTEGGPNHVGVTPTANVNSDDATATLFKDTVPPAAPVVLTPADGSSTSDGTPAISGTAEANSTVTVYLDGVLSGATTADGSGNWAYTPISALAVGAHTVYATATDAASNVSPNSNTNTFTILASQLLKNPDFDQATKSMLPRYWSPNFFVKGMDTLVRSNFQGGKYSLRLTGNGWTKAIMQTVVLTGAAGDKFTLGLWSKALGVPRSGTYAVQVQFMDGKILAGKTTAKFANGTHTWKQVTKTFTAPADYTSIRFIIIFGKASGAAWFDGASLVKEP